MYECKRLWNKGKKDKYPIETFLFVCQPLNFKKLNFCHHRNFIQFQTEFLIAIFSYFRFNNDLRIHWRLSAIIKTNNKSVWSNAFWYVTVFVFWKCIQYAIHWDKTQMLKKIPFEQINGTKTDLFFFHKLLLITVFVFVFVFFWFAILIWAEAQGSSN